MRVVLPAVEGALDWSDALGEDPGGERGLLQMRLTRGIADMRGDQVRRPAGESLGMDKGGGIPPQALGNRRQEGGYRGDHVVSPGRHPMPPDSRNGVRVPGVGMHVDWQAPCEAARQLDAISPLPVPGIKVVNDEGKFHEPVESGGAHSPVDGHLVQAGRTAAVITLA